MTLRRLIFWAHLGTGITIGLVMAFIALTGSILAFQAPIVDWAERDSRIVSPSQSSCVAPSVMLKNAANFTHGVPTSLTLFADPHRPAQVGFGTNSLVLVSSCDGGVIGSGAAKLRSFFAKVRDLHRWIAWGGVRHERLRGIKDACVLAFLFLILCGLVLWFPRKLSRRHLWAAIFFRRGLKGRARDWNWHNVLGFWLALPLTVMALCGVVMAYPWANALLYRAAGDRLPAARTQTGPKRAKPLSADKFQSLDVPVQRATIQDAKWKMIEIQLPSDKDRNMTFRVDEGYGSRPQQRALLVLARKDGSVVQWEPFSENSRGRRWRLYARFLHTGEMFGMVGRFIAMIACLSLLTLVWTGTALALRRFSSSRRRKVSHADAMKQPLPQETGVG